MTATSYRIAEIFGPVLQGEGSLIGTPTIFVRFGGCDYRCAWCDSLHAVLPQYRHEWEAMAPAAILDRCNDLIAGTPYPRPLITLSGGNPALYDLRPLLGAGHDFGWRFALETQGSRWPPWLHEVDHLVLSPKPPSSGERPDLDSFARCWLQGMSLHRLHEDQTELKVVVMDEGDLDFLGRVRALGLGLPLTASVGNPNPPNYANPALDLSPDTLAEALLVGYRWLSDAVLARGWFDVRVLPQLHVLAYGNLRGK